MKPSELYQQKVASNEIQNDELQRDVLSKLDKVYEQISNKKSLFSFYTPSKGIYLWGGVGIGKTFLMDCLYDSLTIKKKQRMHFHNFMKAMHEKLNSYHSQKNPIQLVAKDILKETQVLCFDEFFVKDIADAMLLGGLLEELFKGDFCLIATSNVEPEKLYWRGLQRQNFLKTIKLIEDNTEVIYLNSQKDYRLHFLKREGVYYTPLNKQANNNMNKAFRLHSHGEEVVEPIKLYARNIEIIKRSENCIWFEFENICGVPRSQMDYIALSKQYKTVLVSDIKQITEKQVDLLTCFINMIDVFYDAKVQVIISAEVLPNEIYSGEKLKFEFERTKSRLEEMGSEAYFNETGFRPTPE